ncbi:hypothetical protein CNYM01_02548 [Colletotrichum nymphaeae SA-01]|uniref:Uncharacterized protein n=1 Tax=Colletotrichum nymphaeae SA-01 TaxID=1460502 RepID=A0A135TIG7_9PEZI|nr:hypothetical protein CNYM01_02548 [Colletotrichum nymphaeae SA-01]
MDPDEINWKDAFLFFYWDLHDEDSDSPLAGKEKYDDFILEFLKGERLPPYTLSRPKSWNHLLWHLMRSSLYQTGKYLQHSFARHILTSCLGLNLGENSTKSNYSWLHNSPSQTEGPWVNWMELLDIYSEQVEFNEQIEYDNGIFWVLEYLEERAYANVSFNLAMNEAWASNPYLLDFGQVQGLQPDWAVSLPIHGASSSQLGLPYVLNLEQGFVIEYEVDSNAIRLYTEGGLLGGEDALSLAYFHYTTMLRWAYHMMLRGRVFNIHDFFQSPSVDRHWSKPENAVDRLRIKKELWQAGDVTQF